MAMLATALPICTAARTPKSASDIDVVNIKDNDQVKLSEPDTVDVVLRQKPFKYGNCFMCWNIGIL